MKRPRASLTWPVPGMLLALGLGCTNGGGGSPVDAGMDGGPCGLAFLGDPGAPPRFTLTALGPDFTAQTLAEGSTASLITPIQGGRVAFIGVRGATNLDPCGATLLAAVRDPLSRQVRLDARTINLTPGVDGLGMSDELDVSTFANVPLCPNQWAREAIFDQDYELIVTLTDRRERSATRSLTFRLACNVPSEAAVCRCLCKKDYKLGDDCPGGR